MKVWIVTISDCESNDIEAICRTKKIAERELFKARDGLVKRWKKYCVRYKDPLWKGMINNLSGEDYNSWDNYPNEVPCLCSMKVLEE